MHCMCIAKAKNTKVKDVVSRPDTGKLKDLQVGAGRIFKFNHFDTFIKQIQNAAPKNLKC